MRAKKAQAGRRPNTIKTRCWMRDMRVPMLARTKYLAVTPIVSGDGVSSSEFTITHRPSGFSLPLRFNSLDAAKRWLKRLTKDGGNWNFRYTKHDYNADKQPPNTAAFRKLKAEYDKERARAR